MAGFCRRLKVNEGVRIEGDGQTIDVVIIDIYIAGNQKQVFFRVDGFEGLERFMLDYHSKDMEEIPGVRIGVAERTNTRVEKEPRGRTINLACFVEDGYEINRRKYPV
jgi:hypothetical protein